MKLVCKSPRGQFDRHDPNGAYICRRCGRLALVDMARSLGRLENRLANIGREYSAPVEVPEGGTAATATQVEALAVRVAAILAVVPLLQPRLNLDRDLHARAVEGLAHLADLADVTVPDPRRAVFLRVEPTLAALTAERETTPPAPLPAPVAVLPWPTHADAEQSEDNPEDVPADLPTPDAPVEPDQTSSPAPEGSVPAADTGTGDALMDFAPYTHAGASPAPTPQPVPDLGVLVTARRAAALLGVNQSTIRRRARERELRPVGRLGNARGTFLFRPCDLTGDPTAPALPVPEGGETVHGVLVPTKAVAQALGVHTTTVTLRVRRGELPPVGRLAGESGPYLFRICDVPTRENGGDRA